MCVPVREKYHYTFETSKNGGLHEERMKDEVNSATQLCYASSKQYDTLPMNY